MLRFRDSRLDSPSTEWGQAWVHLLRWCDYVRCICQPMGVKQPALGPEIHLHMLSRETAVAATAGKKKIWFGVYLNCTLRGMFTKACYPGSVRVVRVFGAALHSRRGAWATRPTLPRPRMSTWGMGVLIMVPLSVGPWKPAQGREQLPPAQ